MTSQSPQVPATKVFAEGNFSRRRCAIQEASDSDDRQRVKGSHHGPEG